MRQQQEVAKMGDVIKIEDKTRLAAGMIAAGYSVAETMALVHGRMPGPCADCPASAIVAGYRYEAVIMATHLKEHLDTAQPGLMSDSELAELAGMAMCLGRQLERYLQVGAAATLACVENLELADSHSRLLGE
jgi:hypothetical protein